MITMVRADTGCALNNIRVLFSGIAISLHGLLTSAKHSIVKAFMLADKGPPPGHTPPPAPSVNITLPRGSMRVCTGVSTSVARVEMPYIDICEHSTLEVESASELFALERAECV